MLYVVFVRDIHFTSFTAWTDTRVASADTLDRSTTPTDTVEAALVSIEFLGCGGFHGRIQWIHVYGLPIRSLHHDPLNHYCRQMIFWENDDK